MKALRDRKGNRIRPGDKVVVELGEEAVVCLVEDLGRSNLTVQHKGKSKKISANKVVLYRRKIESQTQNHDFQPGQWVRINSGERRSFDGWVGKVNFLVNSTTVSVLVPPVSSEKENWQEPVCPVSWLETAEPPEGLPNVKKGKNVTRRSANRLRNQN